jgi:hypothetical protein
MILDVKTRDETRLIRGRGVERAVVAFRADFRDGYGICVERSGRAGSVAQAVEAINIVGIEEEAGWVSGSREGTRAGRIESDDIKNGTAGSVLEQNVACD